MIRKTVRGLFALSLGCGAYLGYKTFKKSQRHPPILRYNQNLEVREDKNNVMYDLKSRDQHLQEVSNTEYDLLIIGTSLNFK